MGTCKLNIHLKTKALTPSEAVEIDTLLLDIHLKVKASTPYKLEYNESQLFITKN